MAVPLTWTFKTEGGESVKQTLDQLSDAFNRAKESGEGLNKAQRNLQTGIRGTLGQQRLQNNLFMAQHPNLLRVSRGLSTVTSITRTLLTISNALNLSKIANQGLDANTIAINNDVAVAKRKLMELDKAGAKGTDEWYEATEALNLALGRQKENSQAIIDQKWDAWLTTITTAVFGVGTIFTNLINNPIILKALMSAGGYFGGVFSGFFVLASKAITGVAAIITNTLGITSPVNKAAVVAGTESGVGFGSAFLAGVAGTVTGIALGVILFPTIDKALKDAFPFYKTFAEERDKISNDNANKIFGKDSEFKKGAQSIAPGFFGNGLGGKTGGFIGPMQPSSPIVSPITPTTTTSLVSSIDKTDTNFKNLDTQLISNSTNISDGNKILADYTAYVKEFNPADKSAREAMKNHTAILSGNIATNSSSTGLNIISTKDLITSNDKLINATNSLANALQSSGGSGGGSSGGTYIGLGAKTISAQQALSNRTGITTYDTKGNISTTPQKYATGFEGMVNTPQLMMVGDAGPEYVSVTPHGGTRSGGGATIIVNIAGSVVTEKQLFSRLDDMQKNNLKRRGFTGT